MLYNVINPMGYINEGYRYAAATTAAMDRGYKETRSQEAPPHTVGEAIMNTGGGAFMGYELGHLLGESGIKLPSLLGGGQEVSEAASSVAQESAKGALGLNPWTTLIGAGIGLLSYLFS